MTPHVDQKLTENGVLSGQFLHAQSHFPTTDPNFAAPALRHASMNGMGLAIGHGKRGNAAYERRVTEAARLFRDCLRGDCPWYYFAEAMNPSDPGVAWLITERYPGLMPRGQATGLGLREVMSVTDYQALFVDVIDRIYYGYYNAYPIVNMPLVRQHDLRDFRLVSRYLLDGLVTPFTIMDAAAPPPEQSLSGPVPQDGASFPTTNTAPIQYQPSLYQARASVNWRAMVNDDLGIFNDIAMRLGISANRGISQFITEFFFSSAGLNATLFKAGYNNLITTTYGAASNNPPLSQQGLQDAWKVLAGMVDSSGYPIMPMGKPYLVHGPAYKATAENLKSSSRSMISVEGGTANAQGFPSQFVEAANWAMQNMELIMDPFIPLVASAASGNIKHTAWCLVLDPNAQNRPSVEVGFLNGFKTPQLFRRMPNTMRVGGGVDETMGNFDSMDNDMKIVSVFGGTVIDGRACVGSTGAGV
jgi:hypothetical protein